jgi:hypothetical protein
MRYENYPVWILLVSNGLALAIYLTGSLIVVRLGLPWLLLYLLFLLVLEFRLLKESCVNCYYYGKRCAFGKGKLSSLIFKRGQGAEQFAKRNISLKEIVPDLLVAFLPIIIGIMLLVIHFDWILLLLIIILFLLSSLGNGFVRGSLACKYCKQQELGCPAEKLFNKKRSQL